jgi:hypothetical protein
MSLRKHDANDAKKGFCPFILIKKDRRRASGTGKIIRIKVKRPSLASFASCAGDAS